MFETVLSEIAFDPFLIEGRYLGGLDPIVVGLGIFGGAPIFSPEVPQYSFKIFKGFRALWTEHRGAPKTYFASSPEEFVNIIFVFAWEFCIEK